MIEQGGRIVAPNAQEMSAALGQYLPEDASEAEAILLVKLEAINQRLAKIEESLAVVAQVFEVARSHPMLKMMMPNGNADS